MAKSKVTQPSPSEQHRIQVSCPRALFAAGSTCFHTISVYLPATRLQSETRSLRVCVEPKRGQQWCERQQIYIPDTFTLGQEQLPLQIPVTSFFPLLLLGVTTEAGEVRVQVREEGGSGTCSL
uniref:Uncharacterized protein n=1 Tax=Papio anubis TaxID=9555 RepID=A0A2I3M1J8_PAPAN